MDAGSSSDSLVLVERPRDAVACVTLIRPAKKNALSIALRDEVTATLGRLAADEGVKVVALVA
jgi:enoyl-CoA hydratase/carnithine racemase